MKKTLTIIALAFISQLHAQDIITKKNGDDIKAKVLEVTKTEIKYKRFESPDGAIYTMDKADIVMIRYKDGTKDLFVQEDAPAEPTQPTHSKPATEPVSNPVIKSVDKSAISTFDASAYEGMSMKERGEFDAQKYYRKYRSAVTGTFLMTMFTDPLLGLIPAVKCSKTPPRDEYLGYPSAQLMKNPEYAHAYRNKAHEMKKRKTWAGYAVGSIMSTAVIGVTVGALLSESQ